jgi:hypothetical protein
MKKLSILIPSYNYKKGLIRILDSFKYCDINDLKLVEIIIGDDSKQALISKNEINYYKSFIPNLSYIHNIKNLYIDNWNNLISLAKGEFYWLLHHDEEINQPLSNLHNIILELNTKNSVFIIPICKYKTYKFLKYNLDIFQLHTAQTRLIKKFIFDSRLFLYINIIGSPSSLILKKEINILYDKNLSWLVDVDFYYRLFKKINLKNVRILNKKQALILSNQNYSNSITRIRKIDIISFNKLKKKELNLIEKLNDIKIKSKLRLIFYWILYKLFIFLSYKFYFKKNT